MVRLYLGFLGLSIGFDAADGFALSWISNNFAKPDAYWAYHASKNVKDVALVTLSFLVPQSQYRRAFAGPPTGGRPCGRPADPGFRLAPELYGFVSCV